MLQVLVVDDDEVSREVLGVLLNAEGYSVETAESGDAALQRLHGAAVRPSVVLIDLQMPGTRGGELAHKLRAACGRQTLLLAMSGSNPDNGVADGFDCFLLKPFSLEQFAAAMKGARAGSSASEAVAVLDEAVYERLRASMGPQRLEQLYALCLTDSERRLAEIKSAAARNDDATFRREAHAIKGGCGMVGATELQILANTMETKGIEANHVATLNEFLLASERLRRILVARKGR